jgi:serine/threonine protein kinase
MVSRNPTFVRHEDRRSELDTSGASDRHDVFMSLLSPGTVVQSENHTHQRYVILDELGVGGFGDAFRVGRLDERDRVYVETCLKVTDDASTWHGEAYFGSLLKGDSHVVQLIDDFPIMVGSGRAARLRFCLELELIEGGTVLDACSDGRLPWPEDRVRRQIRLILKPLSSLHRLGTSHRDITPANVFIGDRSKLKLGDFGLVKSGLHASGVAADAYTQAYKPPLLGTWWAPSDDVYQVGLLAMTLLAGSPVGNEVTKWDVNQFTSRGSLREVIKKAISVKSQRYLDAAAMAADLVK